MFQEHISLILVVSIKPGSQYDAGTVSVTSVIMSIAGKLLYPGQNAITGVQNLTP